MYLVYKSPPSDITWGLVRDTTESIIDPSPWPDVNEAVTYYYYFLDLEEGCVTSAHPREPGHIWWCGFPLDEALPARLSGIPDSYRYTPPPGRPPAKRDQRVVNEPRRYADPL